MKQIPWSSLSARSCRNRRKGCNFAWEQCKLGDVAKITMGQSPNSKNYTDNPKDHILVQGNADMKDGQVHPRIWTTEITKIADKGDLILSVRAPVGDIGKTSYDVVIGRGVAAIKGNEFIFQLLKRMKTVGYWTKYSTGSTFESINSLEINNAVINLPKEHEQNKVGKILSYMDHAITLHEEKKRQLERLKSALLQKMFANKSGYPVVRFEGFSDEWEQCKLSDISEKSYEKNTYNKYSTVLTNSAEYGIVKQRDFFDKDIANSSNISGYYVVRKNYFVYNPRISNQAKFGPINRNKLDESGIMSPLYLVFTVHDIDVSFLETLFQTTTWHRFMYQNGDTGARADRFAIKDSTFMSMPIKVPSLEEQHKLALAFQKLDQTITLHQRKLDLLKEQKKGFLQKMFV
ncbi:restriction endonuclease subunit S [Lactobacillus delbrueckii]|uniref:restriction endonuclease subunit S n=2 Tax=Lactobacillus delbrueckii TaxID=1584 RepID=UPI0022AF99AF|nr:restriction endonuclease subunit S [Lactobacillus delbrueckii]